MNSTIIDIVFVLFFVFMAIIGYKNGFVTRLYDLVSLIIVFFLTIWLTEPLSQMFRLYSYNQEDIIASTIGSMINYFIVMIITFVVLFIIKKIIGILFKPVLKTLIDTFSLTEFVDSLLGLVLSVIESIFIAYLVVLLLITPLCPNGGTIIDQTKIAKHILNIIPSITNQVRDLQKNYNHLISLDFESKDSIESIVELVLTAQDFGLVSEEQFIDMYNMYVKDKLNGKDVTLTQEQKQQVQNILKESQLDEKQIQSILNQINVSE